ncbi:CHT3 [Candida theae]|uniref:chitinase n=1 Tax=Candida theae TaxID=1198502 RepID=A0AAD5BEX3_9ASCO|nr:CHT3 [Candida theae]KAI5957841.1 CHT3 [Candida theae]
MSRLFQFISIIAVFATAAFAFDPTSNSNVAVYWGQNSGGGQQRLSYYCDSDAVDIVILSFMHVFPNPVQLNFANACEGTFTPDGILKCDTIAADIQSCQAKGKIILLSLGGASGAYGFSSDDQAREFAHTVWDLFGNSDALSAAERPFGGAILDGFDFDIENHISTGYAAMADELRTIFATDSSKRYYLGAAPQCPYPDASVGNLLQESFIDFVFIQFYNNYCNLGTSWFNWDTWLDYAENTSPNTNVKLFVGVPGSIRAAGSGYNPPELIEDYLTSDIKSSEHFGGISMWDVSAAWDNTDTNGNFVENMKRLVNNDDMFQAAAVSSSDSTTTTTTTTITTTSTTYISETTTTSSSSRITSSSSSSSATSTTSSTSTSSSSSISSSPRSTSSSSTVITSSSSLTLISSTHNADLTTTDSTNSPIQSVTNTQKNTISETTDTQKSTLLSPPSSSSSSPTSLTSPSTLQTSLSTPTNVFTSVVFAPTTMTTISTFYNIITTRYNLQTIYGPPPTTTI